MALKHCNLPTLAEQREKLTHKFAVDTYNNGIHKNFFEDIKTDRPNTRSKPKVIENFGYTSRFRKSAKQYMAKIINKGKKYPS